MTKNIVRIMILLVFSLFLASCGGGGSSDSGPIIAEQSDYFDGSVYHRYYRMNDSGDIGYATSVDGVTFDKYKENPVLKGSVFPVLVDDNGTPRLIVQHGSGSGKYYIYDVHNSWVNPVLSNDGDPILVPGTVGWGGQMFNVGVAIVGNRWHMLIEGGGNGSFSIGYSYADSEDGHLDFNKHLSSGYVINDAGNASMTFIPERKAILAFHGGDFAATGTWVIRASTASICDDLSKASSWKKSNFRIAKAGIHMADADLGFGNEVYPLIISVGYNQNSIDTYYYFGTKVKLFDSISKNETVNLVQDSDNPTMTIKK